MVTEPSILTPMRIIVLLVAIGLAGCDRSRSGYTAGQFSDPKAAELLGETLPEFSLPSPGGDALVTSASLSGAPSLVVLWATWCPSCLQEIPYLKRTWEADSARGLRMVSLSVDDSPAAVPLVVQRSAMTWPVGISAGPWFGAMGLESIPQVFLVGRDGKIVDSFTGELDTLVFRKALESLLSGG